VIFITRSLSNIQTKCFKLAYHTLWKQQGLKKDQDTDDVNVPTLSSVSCTKSCRSTTGQQPNDIAQTFSVHRYQKCPHTWLQEAPETKVLCFSVLHRFQVAWSILCSAWQTMMWSLRDLKSRHPCGMVLTTTFRLHCFCLTLMFWTLNNTFLCQTTLSLQFWDLRKK